MPTYGINDERIQVWLDSLYDFREYPPLYGYYTSTQTMGGPRNASSLRFIYWRIIIKIQMVSPTNYVIWLNGTKGPNNQNFESELCEKQFHKLINELPGFNAHFIIKDRFGQEMRW